ncbi:EndoU domain-containing protein, partial [Photorhabdus khanii]|uniref:EndoU domain-containing protein n=1 Tax=Photorhabdus khanii TaxID=1004150 RepID=UPI001ADF15CD
VENNSLAGDKARESVKESTEYWKNKVREKLGENTVSQIVNGVLTATGDAGDLALATGDLALDSTLALGSCTMGAAYCDTAINDLKKKNQGAANALQSLVNGQAWDGIKETANKAYQGDQNALEQLSSVITGVLLPVNKLPVAETGGKLSEYTAIKGTISPANQKYVDILSPEAKQHILYGDSPTQGGHLYPGNPGKTVFPQNWTADKVVHEIGDIATSPKTQWYAQTGTGGVYTNAGKPARWVAWEVRDNVRVRVVYEPASGKIVTAFPDNNPASSALKPIKK